MQLLPDLRIHGRDGQRAPHVLNVGVPGVSPEMLMISLDMAGLAVSGGSACSSDTPSSSHVLRAMYGDDALAGTIRFSFGRETDEQDVDRAAHITADVVRKLRENTTPTQPARAARTAGTAGTTGQAAPADGGHRPTPA
jgi:cysteine desulfurase